MTGEISERLEMVRAMAARGMSGKEIAKALGVPHGSISGLCARKSIKLRGDSRARGLHTLITRRSKYSDRWLQDEPK